MVLHIRKALKVKALRLLGSVKDRITIERMRLLRSDRGISALHACVICATSHSEQAPSKDLVKLVLQAGTGSRLRVSHCVNLLLQRMSKTRSWVVALKCLTLIHYALQHGGFIYHDQLISLLPRHGSKNRLNFSRFRDRSSPLAWEASSWIRWYAVFLEVLLKASAMSSSHNHHLSSLQNEEMLARILALEALLREIRHCPMISEASPKSHVLLTDAFRLVVKDCVTKHGELRIHMKEVCQRLGDLTILQLTELLRVYEAMERERETFAKLRELAASMSLFYSKACLDDRVLTDNELIDIKAAFTEALRISATTTATARRRKDGSSPDSFFSVKLLSFGILKTSEAAWRGNH